MMFDHEKLRVYRSALNFIEWTEVFFESSTRKKISVLDQLERVSTSIALNIAEGNGKFTPNDKCKFFDIAHGSAFE
jgi:four helix bundle protein